MNPPGSEYNLCYTVQSHFVYKLKINQAPLQPKIIRNTNLIYPLILYVYLLTEHDDSSSSFLKIFVNVVERFDSVLSI